MVARKRVVRVCDRCPIGKERPATREEFLSLGGEKYRLELCEQHGEELVRVFMGWGRLGVPVDEDEHTFGRFNSRAKEEARHLAELRARQADQDRAEREAHAARRPAPPVQPRLQGLSYDAGEWSFTDHAKLRMAERDVTAVQALRACTSPTVIRPGDTHNKRIHITDEAKVVVDHLSKTILTVAKPDHVFTQRKAQ